MQKQISRDQNRVFLLKDNKLRSLFLLAESKEHRYYNNLKKSLYSILYY
jgi:hypothetical protein